MPVTLRIDDAAGTVQLQDAIDVSVAAELKNILVEALHSSSALHIDVSHVTALDAAAVQLLWCVKRQASQAGVPFSIVGKLKDEVASALQEVGITALDWTAETATSVAEGD